MPTLTVCICVHTDLKLLSRTPPHLCSCLLRENFQRLQQDLAQMILSCLERRSHSSVRRRTLSNQSEEDEKVGESWVESDSSQPEYLHLATVDNTLSTFL